MTKRLIYIIIIVTAQACSPYYGNYIAIHKKNYCSFNFLRINEDSSYVSESGIEWFSYRSFGTWKPIQGKKNHISFKSSSSDYSHIPIYVSESRNEKLGTTIIFTQGRLFYNCEFNEILVNGNPFKIDADTILLSEGVDSLSIRLGYSEWMRHNLTGNILYPTICTQIYYPLDTTSNVYEITLPAYPHLESIDTFTATALFSYVPDEFEAHYCYGKWYLYGENGKIIPYKRLKERKRKE